ncbi:MAG: 4-hydroxythreonine-4-phosphate dehydrogenase PdxA [Bacteroidota bacterium]|jgi:4-hydroxythreonine-4-phosphate dehydrogenase
MKPIIGISIGDINGIGPELLMQALDDNRILEFCTPIIFGNTHVLAQAKKFLPECNLQLNGTKDFAKVNAKQVNVYNCWDDEVTIQPGAETEKAGQCAVRALQVAAQCLKDGQIHALVTMPINKSNTQLKDFPYTGHTPFLKEKFGAKDVCMFMVAEDIRVALLTEHVPVSSISTHITPDAIKSKIAIMTKSLIQDFGIDKPKIAVLGLNPHAGDGGAIGKEEKDIIIPTIKDLQQKGSLVYGPYASDGFFARNHYLQFDAVLAMYHDQGLIPFKSLDRSQGVNYTAGLSVVRTSPDHGTAFDIAGKGVADASSFLNSLFTALDILEFRNAYTNNTARPLKRGIGAQLIKKSSKGREDVIE